MLSRTAPPLRALRRRAAAAAAAAPPARALTSAAALLSSRAAAPRRLLLGGGGGAARGLATLRSAAVPEGPVPPPEQRAVPTGVAPGLRGSQPPLDEPVPGIPVLRPARNLPSPKVRVSTLSNGLRVATQETYGQIATFALFVDAGSMYERGREIGVCHFLESGAFKATTTRSAAAVQAFTAAHGIAATASFNREVLMFKVETLRGGIEPALELLAEAALAPALADGDLEFARQVIAFQRDEALAQPHVLVSEHLYTAAYGEGTPLGRPEKCPDDAAAGMSAATLRGYMDAYFCAPRMVLAAVGVDHDVAVAAAERHFGGVRRAGAPGALSVRPRVPYLGGDVRSSPDWSAMPVTAAAATAKTDFTHLMLCFPTVGWSDDDVVPVCVVDTLLGGGSSFSAGGPGKGMYSRLYREVLSQFAWVESANAFSTQLYDTGVVGVYGAAPPEYAGQLASIMATHLLRLTETAVRPAELSRARNQLASSVLMNLETRGLLAEDIGRQILSHGKRMDPAELCRRIQAVTPADVMRVMRAALESAPAFAAVGDCTHVPEYGAMRAIFEPATAAAAAAAAGAAPARDAAGALGGGGGGGAGVPGAAAGVSAPVQQRAAAAAGFATGGGGDARR